MKREFQVRFCERLEGETPSCLLSDIELIEQFRQSGDQALVGELFVRYSALVYGVCLKYLKDRDEAKDAVMQVFEKLPQGLKEHAITQFKGWLYVTTRNYCLMYLRSQKKITTEKLTGQLMETNFLLHPESEVPLEQNLQLLEQCMDKLPEEQKTCVGLFYLQEKCYKEIAALTGFDYNKVKSHIQNGKRNLKICMDSHV